MDRRITKSRKALRDALVELTEERGIDGFTVNDLCACADLNRGTFYNHFDDKDDLIKSFEDEVMAGMRQFRGELDRITLFDLAKLKRAKEPLPVLVAMFDYLRKQSDFLRAMLSANGDAKFGQRLRDSLCTDLIMGVLHEQYRAEPTPFVDYYVSFYASAYLGVIIRWLETGMQEDSETMARIAMRLLFIKPGESIKL